MLAAGCEMVIVLDTRSACWSRSKSRHSHRLLIWWIWCCDESIVKVGDGAVVVCFEIGGGDEEGG